MKQKHSAKETVQAEPESFQNPIIYSLLHKQTAVQIKGRLPEEKSRSEF